MKLECPNCGQHVEVTQDDLGRTVACANCHHAVIVPRAVDPANGDLSRPPGSVSPQPSSRPVVKIRKRGPLGCELYFWLLVAIVAAAFYYAMHQWHTSPRETLQRIVTSAQTLVEKQPAMPTPEPSDDEETPAPSAPAVTRPDPMVWIAANKDHWPKEVILQQSFEFPAVSNGKAVGSLVVPAGAVVKLNDMSAQGLAVEFMGGERVVPANATDLPTRAYAALVKAEGEKKQRAGTVAAASPSPPVREVVEEPADIRDATPEEIGKGLGAMYTTRATTFRVFAPPAHAVSVVLYNAATGNEGRIVQPLRQQLNGIWDTTLRGDFRGKFYTYLLDANDPKHAREVLDPYAANSVASSTRGRITPLTTPVSPGPALESPTDAIVYEMHVRDFTIAPSSGVRNAGLYLGWTEPGTHLPNDESVKTGLDHLTELGVTHVELMPVQDFENEEESRSYNWGYITSAFFSPEGMFATNPNDDSRVRELKALVDALHARGIGVIMDVVYNHTSGKSSMLSIAPEYYYRRGADGGLANGSGCGNEVKSEAPAARKLILDSMKYWVKEYGIDGFRFDLMALIDQETMREADRELRKLNPNIVLFGEPWTGGASPLTIKPIRRRCDRCRSARSTTISATRSKVRPMAATPAGSRTAPNAMR